jgi:hypothetical protein
MNAYTYYMPVPGLWPADTQLALIEVWKRSWAKQGWNPIVMDETWAMRHPRYKEFKQKFWSLPSEYGHDFEGACFLRYAAMATTEAGGMLLDYDVINYAFAPVAPDPGEMRLYCDLSIQKGIHAGAMLAPTSLYEGLCQLFVEWTPDQRDWNPNKKPAPGHHCSDLSYFMQMVYGQRPRPDWFKMGPGCAEYPEPSWRTSPMVHYGYHMMKDGYWPKYAHIEKIRPF